MQTKHWIEFLVDGKWIFSHEINISKNLKSRIERAIEKLEILKKELDVHEHELLIDVLKQYSEEEVSEAKSQTV